MTSLSSSRSDGSQAIHRAVSLLRAVARVGAADCSLAELARAENMPRSTAHRMLQCLIDEGLVARDAQGKGYGLGPLAHELGLVPSPQAAEVERWRGLVAAVARRTSVTAYLLRRSGPDAVCLLKAEGSAVVRVVPVEVGQRRSLGLGAGAIALLAEQEDAVVEEVVRRLAQQRHSRELVPGETGLWESVRHARKTGFALSQGRVANESFGMGCVIPQPPGGPQLAISIAAHNSLVSESSMARWQNDLREEVGRVVSAG